jgi:hypothetical protein
MPLFILLYFPDKKTATIAINSTEWFENQPALGYKLIENHPEGARANKITYRT